MLHFTHTYLMSKGLVCMVTIFFPFKAIKTLHSFHFSRFHSQNYFYVRSTSYGCCTSVSATPPLLPDDVDDSHQDIRMHTFTEGIRRGKYFLLLGIPEYFFKISPFSAVLKFFELDVGGHVWVNYFSLTHLESD